jgi:hypothetical protein
MASQSMKKTAVLGVSENKRFFGERSPTAIWWRWSMANASAAEPKSS